MKKKIAGITLSIAIIAGGTHVAADKLGIYDFIDAVATIINEGKLQEIQEASVKLNEATVNNAPQVAEEVERKLNAELEAEKQRQVQRLESETIKYFNERKTEINSYVETEVLPAKKAEMSDLVDRHIEGQKEWIDAMIEEVLRSTQESHEPTQKGNG